MMLFNYLIILIQELIKVNVRAPEKRRKDERKDEAQISDKLDLKIAEELAKI
jgi:hypothetical protein